MNFGEAMVRLAPPDYQRIEQATRFDIEIGGAELNTAVGLAMLGERVAWVSRLPDNPLGRLLLYRTRAYGVDVDHVKLVDEARVGLYFLEFGAAPRPSGITYDRINSAMALTQPGQLPWTEIFNGAKWFYVTGITPAISATSAAATVEALQIARKMGVKICLDPNYRSKLWSVADAAAWLNSVIKYVDVLVTNPDDLQRFFGIRSDDAHNSAAIAAKMFNLHAIAMTLRQTPSVWRNEFTAFIHSGGKTYTTRSYEVEIVDRLGAGDAFVSGLLHGLMADDPQKAVDYGTALGALKHTVPGDLPIIQRSEVEELLQGQGMRIRR